MSGVRVVRAVLDSPETRNALSLEILDDLATAIRAAASNPATRLVVVSGAGGIFSSGADLKQHPPPELSIAAVGSLYSAVASCPQPVIARIDGFCLGLAAGLAAACDLAVASADTKFALPEARFGQAPTLAAQPILRRVRRGDASRLMLTAERFSGEHAHHIGLVDESVAAPDIDDVVATWSRSILSNAPGAIGICKRLVNELPLLDAPDAATLAGQLTLERAASAEAADGARARAQRRLPPWVGPEQEPDEPSPTQNGEIHG